MRGDHFQFWTTLEKAGMWEGSQHKEQGQAKNRTDRGTVFGQDWGPEPREGRAAAATVGRTAFHREVTMLTRAGGRACL